jgi:hypothetical protein
MLRTNEQFTLAAESNFSENDSAAIFAKACFGHPSPSKRQK